MKKSTNFSAEKGRRLKIFATIFAAIFALIALATGLALKNYGGGRRTDLAQTTAAATEPTDTSKYWTDEAAWSAAGKDFNSYTLSGSGGQYDPYLIQNEWDLAYLSWTIYTNNPIDASHVSSYNYYYSGIYFEQTADLDLSAYYWQPIGITQLRDSWAASRYFSGCYDGGSHTVSGIFTVAGTGSSGLFGTVEGRSSTNLAIISNVGVIDSFVRGYNDVGGVVGGAENATITNCYNTGSVSGSARCAGGVVGSAYYGTVENCYNTGSVSGEEWVGGVVGSGSATNCYNTGSVEGHSEVGGVVGNGSATNCYNTGSVVGFSDVGGVVGRTERDTVISCYNIGSVSGSRDIGGVVGFAYSSSTIINCYNTGSVSGSDRVGGVVGLYNGSNSTISNTYYGGDCTLDVGIGSGSGSAVKIDEPVEEWAKNQDWYSADAVNADGSPVWSADSPWDFENVWKIVRAPDYISKNDSYPVLPSFVVNFSQVIYWTDEAAWSAAGKDFNSYTLSGGGSQGDPYLIQSEWDLAYLSWTIYTNNPILASHGSNVYYYSGIYFEQTADLDLSAYYWQPIGILNLRDGTSANRYFSGYYDGGSHTVSGLFTPAGKSNGYSYQGLFGYVRGQSSTSKATISNVGVIDSFVQGYDYVGGVVGFVSSNSTISNCYNTGPVSGSGNRVGGVVGRAASSTVTNCYNTGSVSGGEAVGGVVGDASSSISSSSGCTIKNCYNTGSVSGSSYVGGVAGRAEDTTITNCYNTGSVEGYSDVGGVVGYADSGTVENCYNIGSVSGSGNIGGVVGYATSNSVSNTYYGGDCALDVGIGEGSGSAVRIDKPVEEWAKNQDWYSADAVNADGSPVWSADSPWDFETVWEFVRAPDYISTNDGYPVLQGVGGSQVIYWTDESVWSAAGKDFNSYTLSGSGRQADPYLIQSEWDLAYLSWTIYTNNPIEASHVSSSYYYSGIYFEQTADLDLSAYYWQPIGIQYLRDGTSASRYFSGRYDGGSHTVSGLFTPAGSSNGYSYQGLFGGVCSQSSTRKAIISNVGVIDSFVQGYDYVGGVVGYATSSTISNCYNTGSVSGSSDVGGVVGEAAGSTVTNCYNTGSVSGSSYVGGIVGYAGSSSTISNCYNTGSVEGSGQVGGVVGEASTGHLTNCYNTGSVSGSGSQVGGVVGRYNYAGRIENCYNTGSVSGPSYVGGVVGEAATVTVENCYNTGSVNASRNYVGGVVGYANYPILNCYNTGSVSGSSDVGGVVGVTHSGSTVTNCYNTGSVSGSSFVGGVLGYAYSDSTISNTYYGGDCTLDVGIGKGSGSAVEIDEPVEEWAKNQDWYSADAVNADGSPVWSADSPWDFENVWKIVRTPDYISTNDGYPVLQSFVVDFSQVIYWTDEAVWSAAGKDFNNYTLSGSGGQDDPYLIQNEWDLAYLSWTIYTNHPIEASHVSSSQYYYSGIYFEQTADLDLSAYYWQPIGIYYLRDGTSATRHFSGSYDGGSHTVSGLFTPAGSSNGYRYQGLFGYVRGQSSTSKATISNVGVIDSFVQGYNNVGGVVGHAAGDTTVENCYNTGLVNASRNYVGGVVGYANSSTVTNCYNTGSVEGSGQVGGVVGYANSSSTISNCYNTGSVEGSSYIGGVVGEAYSSSTISNCYNTGSVSGSSDVGGVAGEAHSSSTISNCYNTGSVSGSSYVGGIVGFGNNQATTNCYNTGSVSGSSDVGGVVGVTNSGSTVTNCYNTGSVSGEEYVGGIVGSASGSSAVTNCGFEGVINGSSGVGTIVGDIIDSSSVVSNCYAVAESDSEISLVGSNSGSGTIENIVGIITSGGTSKKVYTGSDFSGFAWLNFDSSPVPKGLSWAGQFQEPPAEYAGNSNWILTKMQSEGWSAI